jgi:hypothetical protein
MSRYEIVGPFAAHWLVVHGRQVPFLDAHPANGGKITLTLDQRYSIDISVADAETFIPWIADCIAVAMGYNCHPRPGSEPVRSDPFPPTHGIDWIRAEPGGLPTGG